MGKLHHPHRLVSSKVRHILDFTISQSRENELDMTYTVCKLCKMRVKYVGNTTNLSAHITRREITQRVTLVKSSELQHKQLTHTAPLYKASSQL